MYAPAVSLTELTLKLWQHPKLPVAALAAQHAARATLHHIDEPHRAVFDAGVARLVAWWEQRRSHSLLDAWNEASSKPKQIRDELKGNARKAADICVRALYLQAANLERVSRGRRKLPADCYATEDGDFEKLLRDAIKLHAPTQVRDFTRRLEVLDELARAGEWSHVVSAAQRMGWTDLLAGMRNLAPRLRDLAEALDAGGAPEIIDVGGRPALRVTMSGGARRVGVLSDEETDALRAVIPWVPSATAVAAPEPAPEPERVS